MGGVNGASNGARLRTKTLVSSTRKAASRGRRMALGRAGRFLLESAIEFLVEDSCALCRAPGASRRAPQAAFPAPGGLLLEPVVLRFFGGTVRIRNRPICPKCAGELVTARSAGVLGRRVGGCGIETAIGGIFGRPDGGPDGASGSGGIATGNHGGAGAVTSTVQGPTCIRVLSPFMTTRNVLEIVHLLKFGGYVSLAVPAARAMGWAVRSFAAELVGPALLVPVPMEARARRRRGFNAAERLARELSAELGWPVADILRKTGRTRPQSKTPSGDRAANVRNAFSCAAEASLSGRTVLLVDDLVTTGATSAACGAELLRGGAGSVTVVCFGRAM